MPPQADGSLTPEERDHIAAVVAHERGHSVRKIGGRSEAFFDILRPLLVAWFRRSGPLTSKELSAQTGFSNPTRFRKWMLIVSVKEAETTHTREVVSPPSAPGD